VKLKWIVKLGFVLVPLLFVPSPARADESDDLMRKGTSLRAEGQDAEALRIFQQAYALKPTPSGRAQIALAEQALGLWLKAEEDLEAALTFVDDPWIVRQQVPLQSARTTIMQHVGTLELLGGEPGALVIVDGATVGKLPLPSLRLETGKRRLEVRQNGFHAIERDVNITSGTMARETLVMSPLPKTAPATAATKSSKVGLDDRSIGQTERGLGIGLLIGGGVAAALGGVSLLLREVVSSSYNANPACGVLPLAEECRSQAGTQRTWGNVAIGAFISAGVLAGAGTILVLTAPTEAPRGRPTASGKTRSVPAGLRVPGFGCTPYAGIGGGRVNGGLGCSGTF
jgi:PEGA domain